MKAKPIYITAAMLARQDACESQRELFKEKFGKLVDLTTLTPKQVRELAPLFDCDWAASTWLRGKHYDAYQTAADKASNTYYTACEAAGDAEQVSIMRAEERYQKAIKGHKRSSRAYSAATLKLEASRRRIYAAYEAAIAPPRNIRKAAHAKLFIKHYLAQKA